MTTLYMLDTDTISYVLKGGAPVIDARVRELPPDQVCISSVSRGELLYGVRLKDGAHRLAQLVDQFLTRVRSVPWGDEAADCFGTIAAQLTKGRHADWQHGHDDSGTCASRRCCAGYKQHETLFSCLRISNGKLGVDRPHCFRFQTS